MFDDPIVSEIGKFRDEYAASLGYDLERIVSDLQSRQGKDGRRIVDRTSQEMPEQGDTPNRRSRAFSMGRPLPRPGDREVTESREMAETEEFAHGYHYGDYAGVVLYGPPINGLWLDRLAVSDIYIVPLFRAILDRAWRESGGERVPRLAMDWNTLEGWAALPGPVAVPSTDAAAFVEELAQIRSADVAPHCAGCTVEECIRCAAVIREFVNSRLARGVDVFIEDQ